jgi:Protein of unknown function (DUF2442)
MTSTIKSVNINDDMIVVFLNDGRIISVPLAWYPRLLNADKDLLTNFRLIGRGTGIHWSDLDEDLSLAGILAGIPSKAEKVA